MKKNATLLTQGHRGAMGQRVDWQIRSFGFVGSSLQDAEDMVQQLNRDKTSKKLN